jgi:glutamate 5-kinase
MVIANGEDVNVLHAIMRGENVGTLFVHNPVNDFDMKQFLND